MKISELIKKLQEIQKEHGDIEVMWFVSDSYIGEHEPLEEFELQYRELTNKLYIG